MQPNKVKTYKLEDNTRDTTKTLIVQHNGSAKATDYIVTKTVQEEVFIPDIVSELNQFPKIHARTHDTHKLEVTSNEVEE